MNKMRCKNKNQDGVTAQGPFFYILIDSSIPWGFCLVTIHPQNLFNLMWSCCFRQTLYEYCSIWCSYKNLQLRIQLSESSSLMPGMDKIMVQIKYLSSPEAIPHESLTPWKHDSLWDHQNSLLIAECLQKESCKLPRQTRKVLSQRGCGHTKKLFPVCSVDQECC